MPRVSLDQIAPEFSLPDFSGAAVSLADPMLQGLVADAEVLRGAADRQAGRAR